MFRPVCTDALGMMPRTITGQFTHTHTVNWNAAEVLAQMEPTTKKVATEVVKTALRKTFKEQLPDANVEVED